MKTILKIIWVISLVCLTILLAIYFWDRKIFDDVFNRNSTWHVIINTWINLTWSVEIKEKKDYNKILIENKDFWNYKEKTYDMFPKIKINRLPENIKLVTTVDFADKFKSLYGDYVTSNWYWFALRFFIWNFDNWWFYNVFRKTNWWLGNDPTRGLNWWQVWSKINGWFTREIPLNQTIKVAVPFEKVSVWYQYEYINPAQYLVLWEDMSIGIYLSSTREVEWRRLMKIKELRIDYYWYENDIVVVE